MRAAETGFLELLQKSQQFVVPIYQRTYSWAESECRQLWDDIIRTGENDDITSHFVGSIVYIEKGLALIAKQTPHLVIDGQQRLTTVMLLLEALARRVDNDEPMDGFSAEQIRQYYLINPLEKGDRKYKLILTQTDRDSLISLVRQKPLPAQRSKLISKNFEYFKSQIRRLGNDLSALCKGLAKLVVVGIALDRNQDNPQLIFESMNSTGKDLTQADLIRNFVLMGLEQHQQERLYYEYWRPMEKAFGQEGLSGSFNWFMRHYLTYQTSDIPTVGKVYQAFKRYRTAAGGHDIEALLEDVHKFAGYYCAMEFEKEPDLDLRRTFCDLNEFNVGVYYPWLLGLYDNYKQEVLSKTDFIQIVTWIESYLFRRAVCAIPTNSHNRTFATLGKALRRGDCNLDSIKQELLLLKTYRPYRRFPEDAEFIQALMRRNLYNFRLRNYWLRKLENYGRKETVSVKHYTIEHIMPQNSELSVEWRETLGPRWEEVRETWLHTLGNLTLTGYNTEYGDRPFAEKRDMPGGFRDSPLWLNRGLRRQEVWNEAAISRRAAQLSERAKDVWAIPTL